MSEPLWFLDTSNETDHKLEEDESSDQAEPKSEPDKWSQEYFKTSNPGQSEKSEIKETIQQNDLTDNRVSSGKSDAQSISLDEASLKQELENSLLDIANESIKKRKDPEIYITINTEDLKLDSGDEKSLLIDDSISNDQDLFDESYPKDKPPKIKVKINVSKDGKTVGQEKQFEIDSSLMTQDTFDDENENKYNKKKIFFVISSNKEGKSSEVDKEFNLNSPSSNNQYCTEIGSAVIKLNDFISTETEKKPDSKIVSANVNDSLENGEKKVELVITIKDKRKKMSQPEKTSIIPELTEERNLQRPSTLESLMKKTLESELKNIRERIQQLSDSVNPNSLARNRETASYRKYSDNNDIENQWSSEARDSFVRESDGARCYRTVWTSPEGRKVQTKCYGEERHPLRQRKFRNNGWYPSFGSLWQEMDDEFDRIFNRVNRFMYF